MIGTLCYYLSVIPNSPVEAGTVLKAVAQGDRLDRHMLGEQARIEITHVSPGPGVLYSRICLEPAGGLVDLPWFRNQKAPPSLCFEVDRQVTQKLLPGDSLSVCRTRSGGIGLSVVRDNELVMAAGAVTDVPLGRDVSVSIPNGVVDAAETLFRQRDPEFRWHELPVEITVRGRTRLLFRGYPTIEGHAVFMVHGAIQGLPGIDECLSIARLEVCQPVAASATALLFAEHLKKRTWLA